MSVICVWNKCNSRCLMCTNPTGFREKDSFKDYGLEVLKKRIKNLEIFDEQKKLIDDKIILTGGEPTIHPDFFELIKFIRKEFPQDLIIELDTNGRRFYYPSFTRQLLSFGNINLLISLHGYDAKTHDAVTRVPGSFYQTTTGIKNIIRCTNLGLKELEIRVILTKLTYKCIERILAFIKNSFPEITRVVIIFMEMEGQAGKNVKVVGIRYKDVKKTINRIKKWISQFKEMRFYHFPLCVIDPTLWKYTWRTEPKYEVTFLDSCQQCLYKKYCLGIHKDYLKLVGGTEFSAIKNKNYTIEKGESFYHPIKNVYLKRN